MNYLILIPVCLSLSFGAVYLFGGFRDKNLKFILFGTLYLVNGIVLILSPFISVKFSVNPSDLNIALLAIVIILMFLQNLKFTSPEKSASEICCDKMKYFNTQNCKDHKNVHDCPDVLISKNNNESYGILIQDGGTSQIKILYCPWCGAHL